MSNKMFGKEVKEINDIASEAYEKWHYPTGDTITQCRENVRLCYTLMGKCADLQRELAKHEKEVLRQLKEELEKNLKKEKANAD